MNHIDACNCVTSLPLLHSEQQGVALYLLSQLKQKEVEPTGITFFGSRHFTVQLPLLGPLFGAHEIPMQFGSYTDENGEERFTLSCGPSTYDCTADEIDRYLAWLDRYMPRRGMTLRDVVEAGNPDNLILPAEVAEKKTL